MNRIPPWGIECLREGFTLYKDYNIFCGQDVIGSACVRQEGLFFCFQCRCKPPSGAMHSVIVVNNGKEFNLGVCVPDGEEFTAYKRISIKQFKDMELKFYLREKEEIPTQCVAVEENKPFEHLENLEFARLDLTQEHPQICLNEITVSTPLQPDSDQSQEYQSQ